MANVTSKGWTLRFTVGSVVAGPVFVDEEVKDFRGDVLTVRGGTPPREEGKAGYVYVSEPGSVREDMYYPSVIGAKWVKDEEA